MFNGMKFDTFTLDNGLEVLAISDKRFVKASAALAVMAGSMQNPDEHLGLAHFLEHMLFLGTKEFPTVGEYEDFLNKNGGGHNAYTSIDHTNYFFDVAPSAFEGSLERFSRFFVSPTFDEKYVKREVNAVHSEHEKNLQEDGRREYRFLQMITDPVHPFSKFATGDRETLAKADRQVVMDFYETHYSSNLMRLVMMGPASAEKMRELAQKYFSDIKNKNMDMPTYEGELFLPEGLPKLHRVQSVRDQDVLKISFAMPDDLPYWESKPTGFLAHLLGEEGEGSLLSYLKHKNLAQGLETSTWWRMFHLRINLTESGKNQINEILKAVFSYIEMLKKEGLKKYLFDERQAMAKAELDYIEPKSSMSRASHFSASMLYYPVDSFLPRYYLYHKYSPDEFNMFLSRLTVDNMQVALFTNQEVKALTEPYYGIGYETKVLDPKLVEELKRPAILPELQYPEPNLYVPTDLSLVAKPSIGKPKHERYEKYASLYSQIDTELEIPKASLSLSFISDKIKGDPRQFLLAKLFARLKREELNEWGYPSRLAGLSYSISHGYNTITLDVSGYSHHLPDLLNNLIFDPRHGRQINKVIIDQVIFNRLKTRFKKTLLNKEHDAAYQHLLYEIGHLVTSASVHRKAYIDLIDSVTLDEINEFAEKFFSRVALRSFCFGNIDPERMKPVIDGFHKNISNEGFAEDEVLEFENKYVKLPEGNSVYQVSGTNNNNAQMTLYKCSDWSIRDQAYIDIISRVFEQPYFTELRTHQQLGYVVAAFGSASNGFVGLGTLIQSQDNDAVDIFEKSHHFTENFFKNFNSSLKEEDVNFIKEAVIAEISQTPNSMGERLSRFTMMAGTYHGDFEFLNKLVTELKGITTESIKAYVESKLEKLNDCSKLCLLYNGSDTKNRRELSGFKIIESLQAFKQANPKIQPYKYHRK